MKSKFFPLFQKEKRLTILMASYNPDQTILEFLSLQPDLNIREAFSTQGMIQGLPLSDLVIHDHLIETNSISWELISRTLEKIRVPTITPDVFLANPEEWLSKARLAKSTKISFLPSHQISILNWSGGVGKTTLSLATCKRFIEKTGLPAALLELGMGCSALQARLPGDLPEFYNLTIGKEPPGKWQGVSIYSMDIRSFEVLWRENPTKVLDFVNQIRKSHTLLVFDCFPGHVLFPEVMNTNLPTTNLVIASPREDTLAQAKRLMSEVPEPTHLVLNMARSLADSAGTGASVTLPYNERWATSFDHRLADPLLELVYPGWNKRKP